MSVEDLPVSETWPSGTIEEEDAMRSQLVQDMRKILPPGKKFPQDLGTLPTQLVVSRGWLASQGFVVDSFDPRADWEREEQERKDAYDYEVTEKARRQHWEQLRRLDHLKNGRLQ